MNCRDALHHLDTCPSCLSEIEVRRRLSGALRAAFHRSADLQPPPALADRLRDRLRGGEAPRNRSTTMSRGWLALAAGLVLAALGAVVFLSKVMTPAETLARDAIGDHQHCALNANHVRKPMSLEDAAQRFDADYRLLLSTPPDDIATPAGTAHVVERHSCAFGGRRFGHVILQYRGRVVSLLMAANAGAADGGASPQVIGRPVDGLSAVSVNASRHVIVLVGDLESHELRQLSSFVSVPLTERLGQIFPIQAPTFFARAFDHVMRNATTGSTVMARRAGK